MSDGPALLAAICAHPEEDTPRLAYADWLDEHVGSLPAKTRESVRMRAELIRVQCELARLPLDEEDADTATRRAELELRQNELLKNTSRRKAWAKPLRAPPVGCEELIKHKGGFVRGFPIFPNVEVTDLLAIGEGFFDLGPVHSVHCRNAHGPQLDEFLAQPWLSRVRRLSIGTDRDRSGWVDSPSGRAWRSSSEGPDVPSTEKLLAASGLANLEELELRNWALDAPGAPIAGRALGALKRLNLWGGAVPGPQTFERLGELLPPNVRLKDFALDSSRFGTDEFRALTALPQLAKLERLAFGLRYGDTYPMSSIGVEGVRALTSAPFWANLRAFRDGMSRRGFGPDELKELAAAPPPPDLRTLRLDEGHFGAGFEAFAVSPLLASVTSLALSNNQVGDAGVQRLAKSSYIHRLVNLSLNGCALGPLGVKALAGAPFAANLVRLSLQWCSTSKTVVDALVAPSGFPRLRVLDIRRGVRYRAQIDRLRARFGAGLAV